MTLFMHMLTRYAPSNRTELYQALRRTVAGVTLTCLLAACSGGASDDKIRIGSGQEANSGTTGSTNFPILYIKRSTPDMTMNNAGDVRRLRVFNTNADLYIRDSATVNAPERNITARVHPANQLWDVKDLDISADGTKVIFAMRGPLDDDQEDKDPPSWNIWEYTIASDSLHRVIASNVIAEEGQDVSPHYLPDGHILFSSTRQYQSKAVLLDEGKGQFEAQVDDRGVQESGFVLHVMDGTGNNIQQASFNQSHDMDATVLTDGRVLFSRWDRAAGRNGVNFYTANPDGTNVQLEFGSASHNTFADTTINNTTTFPAVQFTKPHEMPDGRILTLVRPFTGTEFGGDLYMINTRSYVESNQLATTGGAATLPATAKATPGSVRLINAPSPNGRFVAAAPLWDGSNRMLASWTLCRVIDPATTAVVNCTEERLSNPAFVAAPPVYGLWMFNPSDGTQQPIVPPVEGVMVTDVVVAQARTAPAFRAVTLAGNLNLNQTLRGEGVGILDIRSVYDFDGTVPANTVGAGCNIANNSIPGSACYTTRPARFLRIEKAVSLPDEDVRDVDNNAFGATNFMREILGYIPIEPDGSVRTKVPGNVAFQISVVDNDGRRVTTFPLHNAWLSIRPGETVQCTGCHRNSATPPAGQSGRSHGRSGSFASAYTGATGAGVAFNSANSLFAPINGGDTMAQARAAWSCANEQCASITPSVNVAFADVWPTGTTDSKVIPTPPTVRPNDFALRYAGTGGLTTRIPTSSTCLTTWSNTCRITINYLENIQPLWEKPISTTDAAGVTTLIDVNGDTVTDAADSCLACHSKTDAANAARVPAGDLDLSTDASDDNNLRITSYQELLFQDIGQIQIGAAVQDECILTVTDPITMVVTCAQFRTVSPSIAARNARGSRFFNRFTPGNAAFTHMTNGVPWLTAGELRLISEWVDIGAQYYNDPFKAPEN